MPDRLTPQQRHDCMSHIRSNNTKPEVKLRKELFRLGYRYRLNVKSLPGKPDIVLAKYRSCIFVNGCFWHGHKGCPKFVLPKTNAEFWMTKIENNRERDLRDYTFLESKGWRVIVVWECELKKGNLVNTVYQIQKQLDINREGWLKEKADRWERREEWKEEMKRRRELNNKMISELKLNKNESIMDQPKIERMLRLMRLMASNTNYTIDELAEKLKMSYRTIYRYIDTFKASGFAVAKLYGNVYKLGKMPKKAPDFANLIYFSEEEAYIVNSLIDNLDQTNNLKANLKRKLATIYNSTNVVEYIDKKSNTANIRALSEAIKNKQKVKLIGYESARSETVKDRLVEPFAFSTNLIDVWAYDLGDLHNKVFKISRIGEVETLDEDWEFEGSHRRQSTDVFRMSGKSAKKIKLRLGLRAKNLLLEEYPLAAKDITRKGAYWILETGVYDYAGVCRFYCGLADDIEIVGSPELEAYVQKYAREHIIR